MAQSKLSKVSKQPKWIELTKSTLQVRNVPVLAFDDNHVISLISDNWQNGIYKCNVNRLSTKWDLLSLFPDDIKLKHLLKTVTFAYDIQTKIIMIYVTDTPCLYQYNCKTNASSTIPKKHASTYHPYIMFIDGNLHLIGGEGNKSHTKCNIVNGKTETIHRFNDWKSGNYDGGLVYCKSKRQLVLITGYDEALRPGEGIYYNMWTHIIGSNKWKRKRIDGDWFELYEFGYIVTSDDKYIITFGGSYEESDYDPLYPDRDDYSEESGIVRDIWVLETDTLRWRKTKLQVPMSVMTPSAVLMRDSLYCDVLIYGFARSVGLYKDYINIPGD